MSRGWYFQYIRCYHCYCLDFHYGYVVNVGRLWMLKRKSKHNISNYLLMVIHKLELPMGQLSCPNLECQHTFNSTTTLETHQAVFLSNGCLSLDCLIPIPSLGFLVARTWEASEGYDNRCQDSKWSQARHTTWNSYLAPVWLATAKAAGNPAIREEQGQQAAKHGVKPGYEVCSSTLHNILGPINAGKTIIWYPLSPRPL